VRDRASAQLGMKIDKGLTPVKVCSNRIQIRPGFIDIDTRGYKMSILADGELYVENAG